MDQGSLISHAVYKTCKDDLHARTLRTFKVELDAHGADRRIFLGFSMPQ